MTRHGRRQTARERHAVRLWRMQARHRYWVCAWKAWPGRTAAEVYDDFKRAPRNKRNNMVEPRDRQVAAIVSRYRIPAPQEAP